MNQGPICAKVNPEGIQPIKGNNCGLIPVYGVGKKTKMMRLILALFLPFFIFSHLSLVLKMRKFVSSQVAMLLG